MLNDVVNGSELANSRAGGELVVPLSRHQSIKLAHSRGVYTRTGTAFSVYALAWQYRWAQATRRRGQRRKSRTAQVPYGAGAIRRRCHTAQVPKSASADSAVPNVVSG